MGWKYGYVVYINIKTNSGETIRAKGQTEIPTESESQLFKSISTLLWEQTKFVKKRVTN